jgi:hypothetical protein
MPRERGNGAAVDIEPGIVARVARGVAQGVVQGVAQGFRAAFARRTPNNVQPAASGPVRRSAPSDSGRSAPTDSGRSALTGLGRSAPGIDRGPTPESWFGPLEPLTPIAPPSVAGRQFDYPSGYNIVTQPRPYEPVTFHQLRGLADAYDLLRLVIETRKDQIARLAWTIRPRKPSGASGGASGAADPRAADLRVQAIADFLAAPDREHGWDSWLRMLLEDLLVIDAPCLYVRLDNAGRLYALEPIDGATIKRVIDDAGRTPIPPAPAYQQILKGLPAVDYSADELLYLPRNPRSNRVYGYSPVEQIVMTVNIALRRQLHQLQYYTEGTVPEALIGVPEAWTPDQIGQFQSYWDALLTDDTASRRHARFVPATISKSFVQTKEAALKDDYDEWLARIVCYAFSVSPQWAVKAMNRATAETAQQQAEDEGLAPLLMWVKGALDRILRQCFAAPDLEFHWLEEQDQDSQAQAQVDQIYLAAGVKSINEVRAEQGLAPVAGGEAPLVTTGTGIVPLAQAAKGMPSPSPAARGSLPLPLAGEGRGEGPSPVEGEGRGGGSMEGESAAKYAPDQPRVPAGQTGGGRFASGDGGGGTTTAVDYAPPAADTHVADSTQGFSESSDIGSLSEGTGQAPAGNIVVADQKSECIEECYTLLERAKIDPGSNLNEFDFHKCVNDCMNRNG